MQEEGSPRQLSESWHQPEWRHFDVSFREARINCAALFFDERESLFMDRTKGGSSVNMILTELERFDGLCMLVTNWAHNLDKAMH